ncbi:12410_t:CDS:2, partial [Ambispora gerdemannii]
LASFKESQGNGGFLGSESAKILFIVYTKSDTNESDNNESQIAEALNNFFQIYDPHMVTQFDFYIWRIINRTGLPFQSRKSEISCYNNKYIQVHQEEGWTKEEIDNVDIGKLYASIVTWENIKSSNYNCPLLSFIIDLTRPQKELRKALGSIIYEKITRVPDMYFKSCSDIDNLVKKFFNDKKRWNYDDFGSVEDDDKNQQFYFFVRDICKHMSASKSKASKYRKEVNARIPDFYCFLKLLNITHELLYEETSGGPFFEDADKYQNDLYKLFRFGHDSKIKLGMDLIVNNIRYLVNDHEELWKQLGEIENFLLQAHGVYLKVCIFDQPSLPFCRAREIYNLRIPYEETEDVGFIAKYINNLWNIHLGLNASSTTLDKICKTILRRQQEPIRIIEDSTISHFPILKYKTFETP